MKTENKLPQKNSSGFYEIRLESIGGLGANVAGKILGEAGILYQGFNGSSFASYGSEKKGTPVKSFIRLCDSEVPVRINSPVEEPDLAAVFHESLTKNLSVIQGIKEKSTVIVNTCKTPAEMRNILKLSAGRIICIDALSIALREKSRINMVLIGTVCRASGFLSSAAIIQAIKDTFGYKYPRTIPSNIKAFEAGQNEFSAETFKETGIFPAPKEKKISRPVPRLGYQNAPWGGIIIDTGNSSQRDLSASRQGFIPLLDLKRCISCGECDSTCPDYCFVFEKKIYEKTGKPLMFLKGINYQYCKGCLKCVEICKPHALSAGKESEQDLEKLSVKG